MCLEYLQNAVLQRGIVLGQGCIMIVLLPLHKTVLYSKYVKVMDHFLLHYA